ncbi:MAG: pilin [Patescibacteria group bacterium]|jgi:hypothetical protein
MFKKKILVSLLFTLSLLLLSPALVHGEIIPASVGGCPDGYQGNCGNYGVDDFLVLAINVSKWILGIVGSLALLMFIYGGLMFLISAGSADKIGQANKIIIAAVVGLVIVFASFLIIQFVMRSIGVDWSGEKTVITTPTTTSTKKTNDACIAMAAEGYSCIATSTADLASCKPLLCMASPNNVQCCKKPAATNPQNAKCIAAHGATFSCMDKANGKNCSTGHCTGASNIQCCESK